MVMAEKSSYTMSTLWPVSSCVHYDYLLIAHCNTLFKYAFPAYFFLFHFIPFTPISFYSILFHFTPISFYSILFHFTPYSSLLMFVLQRSWLRWVELPWVHYDQWMIVCIMITCPSHLVILYLNTPSPPAAPYTHFFLFQRGSPEASIRWIWQRQVRLHHQWRAEVSNRGGWIRGGGDRRRNQGPHRQSGRQRGRQGQLRRVPGGIHGVISLDNI